MFTLVEQLMKQEEQRARQKQQQQQLARQQQKLADLQFLREKQQLLQREQQQRKVLEQKQHRILEQQNGGAFDPPRQSQLQQQTLRAKQHKIHRDDLAKEVLRTQRRQEAIRWQQQERQKTNQHNLINSRQKEELHRKSALQREHQKKFVTAHDNLIHQDDVNKKEAARSSLSLSRPAPLSANFPQITTTITFWLAKKIISVKF